MRFPCPTCSKPLEAVPLQEPSVAHCPHCKSALTVPGAPRPHPPRVETVEHRPPRTEYVVPSRLRRKRHSANPLAFFAMWLLLVAVVATLLFMPELQGKPTEDAGARLGGLAIAAAILAMSSALIPMALADSVPDSAVSMLGGKVYQPRSIPGWIALTLAVGLGSAVFIVVIVAVIAFMLGVPRICRHCGASVSRSYRICPRCRRVVT